MWPPLKDRLRSRGSHMRGWLVINTPDKGRITIGGLDGTAISVVDLKLVTFAMDALGPSLRLVASFRMNGLQNPEEHDVYFDFNKEAIDSFLKIPGNQEIEEKRRLAKEDERFAGHQNRGELWVLRVRYSRENVRSTGLKQAMDMATPAQKATLMDLAQLREVGEFTFHTKANSAHRKMLKRWERYMEKVTKEAENSATTSVCMEDIRPRL